MNNFDSDDLIEYIGVHNDLYWVKKRINSSLVKFGNFSSLKEAEAAACLLIENDWKLSQVSKNPLVGYDDKFWIFRVEKNELTFEASFSSFESAVEYMEVNQRCNDYHNDILSKRRKRKQRVYSAENEFYEEELNDKFIHKKWGKFVIERSLENANFKYAEFDTLEEAKVAKKLLVDCKWNVDNEFEMIFHNNYYWIFKFAEGVLIYLNKLESYEDAFDFIDSIKNDSLDYNEGSSSNRSFSQDYESKIDLFKTKNNHLGKRPKKVVKRKKVRSKTFYTLNFSFNYQNDKKLPENIWQPKFKKPAKGSQIEVTVGRGGPKVKKLEVILTFKFYKDYYDVTVGGYGLDDYEKNFTEFFPEFHLILNVFEMNNWSLSNIETSSSIYYFDSKYFKIYVLDNEENAIIFQEFESYYLAENMIVTYNKRIFDKDCFHCPLDVVKKGRKYDLVKIRKREVFRVHALDSLEEMKAVHTILVNEDWDFTIFNKFKYFYLNGFYWFFEYNDHELKLIGKLESI